MNYAKWDQGCASQKHCKPKFIIETIGGNFSTINLKAYVAFGKHRTVNILIISSLKHKKKKKNEMIEAEMSFGHCDDDVLMTVNHTFQFVMKNILTAHKNAPRHQWINS